MLTAVSYTFDATAPDGASANASWLKDVVVVLPGIMGSVLAKNGADL